jgi:hypothetical protein
MLRFAGRSAQMTWECGRCTESQQNIMKKETKNFYSKQRKRQQFGNEEQETKGAEMRGGETCIFQRTLMCN